ncbi:MAG: 50S ribosomal protein L22 [Bacteroidetes bacterium]|nr:50S ribosomal protein L22 [Bacteroidota bacterium]
MKAVAVLKKNRMSPRKVRLVADMIRGRNVVQALDYLRNDPRKASEPINKLLLSSISNWHNKNGNDNSTELFISEIRVDGAGMLKRIKPAPQGRAHRIRKRYNHITIAVDSKEKIEKESQLASPKTTIKTPEKINNKTTDKKKLDLSKLNNSSKLKSSTIKDDSKKEVNTKEETKTNNKQDIIIKNNKKDNGTKS